MAMRDWYCEDVLSGKLEITKVWEDDLVLAFHHPRPQSEFHVVVIPKAHVASIMDPNALDRDLLRSMVQGIQETARRLGLDEVRVLRPCNAATPNVTPHMHWHVRGPGVP